MRPFTASRTARETRHDRIDPAQQMAFGDEFIEIERVEQPALIARLPPHQHQTPSPKSPSNGITAQPSSRALFQHHRTEAVISNARTKEVIRPANGATDRNASILRAVLGNDSTFRMALRGFEPPTRKIA